MLERRPAAGRSSERAGTTLTGPGACGPSDDGAPASTWWACTSVRRGNVHSSERFARKPSGKSASTTVASDSASQRLIHTPMTCMSVGFQPVRSGGAFASPSRAFAHSLAIWAWSVRFAPSPFLRLACSQRSVAHVRICASSSGAAGDAGGSRGAYWSARPA